MSEPQIGKITWSPDYKSNLEDKIKTFRTMNLDSEQIEKLLDAAFDSILRDMGPEDEDYIKVRAALKEKFKKILGVL